MYILTQLLCWPYPFSGFYKLEIFARRVFGKDECWNVEGFIDCVRKRCIIPHRSILLWDGWKAKVGNAIHSWLGVAGMQYMAAVPGVPPRLASMEVRLSNLRVDGINQGYVK